MTITLVTVLLSLLCALLPVTANALTVEGDWYELNGEFEYLDDPDGEITIRDLLRDPSAYAFTHSRDSKPRVIFAPFWLRLTLDFTDETRARRYLLVPRSENLFDLRVYRPGADGTYSEHVTGNNYPAGSRELDMPRYGFLVEPRAEGPTVVYLRVVGGAGSNNLPWDLVEQRLWNSHGQTYYLLTAACLAAIGALLVFNMGIAVSLRRRDYAYYSGYVATVFITLFTLEGYSFKLLWPEHPALNQSALHTFAILSALLRLLAIDAFLGVTRRARYLGLPYKLTVAFLLLWIAIINLRGVSNLPPMAPIVPWAFGSLMGYALCVQAIRLRVRLAWPLLICMLIPNLASLVSALLVTSSPTVGLVETQLTKAAFTLHVLLFSVCLATQIKSEVEGRKHALHDRLTGLPGKQLLRERFDWVKTVAAREEQNLMLLFIDLDGFKQVNDSMGHAAGDDLLRQVAGRMREELRDSDFVARLGGDEFVALLCVRPTSNAPVIVSGRLVQALSRPFSLAGQLVTIGASIGIAREPEDGQTLDALLRAADAAMYKAKNNGKNGYFLADNAAGSAYESQPRELPARAVMGG
ncbi:MAG: diguanylate cyclase [Halioglobus sp.]|nr:diguanylate cyclase [Halioglobus sp.]